MWFLNQIRIHACGGLALPFSRNLYGDSYAIIWVRLTEVLVVFEQQVIKDFSEFQVCL